MTNLGKNSNGVPFNSRIVKKGEKYGLDFCLTYDENEPLVEFYDARYPHTEFGQFVSRYYYSTLSKDPGRGINLDGGVDDWFVDAHQVDLALAEIEKK